VAPVTRTGFSGMSMTSGQKSGRQDDDGGSRFNFNGKGRPQPQKKQSCLRRGATAQVTDGVGRIIGEINHNL
jgi:hypothetical protein